MVTRCYTPELFGFACFEGERVPGNKTLTLAWIKTVPEEAEAWDWVKQAHELRQVVEITNPPVGAIFPGQLAMSLK